MEPFPILILEDEPDDKLILRRAFDKNQFLHPLFFLDSGEDAIAYLKGEGRFCSRGVFPIPRLIITDLKLPRRTGLEFLEWLRASPFAAIPTVVLTSSNQPIDFVNAISAGAVSYHLKPTDFSSVRDIVYEIIDYTAKGYLNGKPVPSTDENVFFSIHKPAFEQN